jgi:N-acetylglutamate synthase-like GNAT family acetyltransferase
MVGFAFKLPLKLPHGFKNAIATRPPDMSQQILRIRRATVDDCAALKTIWAAMRLPAEELEKRLTEFQVVENAEGEVVGALGFQILRQHALLHNESYGDFAVADAARELFWERLQKLAANHGVFRVWTQERSPFWKSFGFRPPNAEVLGRLPAEWKNEFTGGWLTLQLKNEEVITAALEQQFAGFMAAEKLETERLSEKARTLRTVVTILGFAIGIICISAAIYLFLHRNPFGSR